MTSASDIVDLLVQDHATLRDLSSDVGARSRDDSTAYLELSDRLLRHEIAEELVVYPALLTLGGGAGAVADSRLEDQADIEHRLVQLERQEPGTVEFERISTILVLELLAHLDKEESQVLPILASQLGRGRRTELGNRFREVTLAAPPAHLSEGMRVTTGRTVVDRTTMLSVWIRDVAAASGLAG